MWKLFRVAEFIHINQITAENEMNYCDRVE